MIKYFTPGRARAIIMRAYTRYTFSVNYQPKSITYWKPYNKLELTYYKHKTYLILGMYVTNNQML